MGYKDSEGNDLEEFASYGKIRDTMDAIRKLESADGKLLDHPVIESGEQKGMKAVGEYGLTPVGFFDGLRVLGNREGNKEFKRLGSVVGSNSEIPNEDKQMIMENMLKAQPELQERIVRDLAARLLVRQRGDVGKAAVAYEGNPFQSLMSDERMASDPRIRRLASEYGIDLAPKSQEPKEEEEKPLALPRLK